jgi:hypothetical protein
LALLELVSLAKTCVEQVVGITASGLRMRHSCIVEVGKPATSTGMVVDEMFNFRDVSSV